MANATETLLDRAERFLGDDVIWVMPDASAALSRLEKLRAVHPFRPGALALEGMGVPTAPQFTGKTANTIALNLPRQAEWACGLLSQALDHLTPGGNLLMIAPNDLGGKRYAKLLGEHFDVSFAESKAHCRLAVVQRPATLPAVVNDWRKAYTPSKVEGTELLSMPGTFSHGRVDAGSALLAQHLPELSGHVADFGGGWGYLSHHVLSRTQARVDLFEADDNALALARRNLAAWESRTRFFWHDILTQKTTTGYDAVIMNPPFHDLAEASPDIGRGFIAAAARALKDGGLLWLVANTHLPYEETLKESFREVRQAAKEKGFKVLAGVK